MRQKSFDYILWVSLLLICGLYISHLYFDNYLIKTYWLATLAASVFQLINTIWWGILIGILMISVLGKIPREFIISILGTHRHGLISILRATIAGVLLDLCSHGILMVGAKLYERGASIGQVIAFLVASPWNSFSLTLILVALIGLQWTLVFVFLSMLVAITAGLLFDIFVKYGVLPQNSNQTSLPDDFQFWQELKLRLKNTNYTPGFFAEMLRNGLSESRMVIRWLLFGVLLAGLIRAFISIDHFENYFGPTLAGLGVTLVVATVLEVCSEGSTPIAADIFTRAKSPGNSFAFLMAGISTDYTEIMVLRDTGKSWKVALFLPLLTVPQIILIAWLMNNVSV